MKLARTAPGCGGLPDLHSFDCRMCHVVFTQAATRVGREFPERNPPQNQPLVLSVLGPPHSGQNSWTFEFGRTELGV
jgi:hypothetical protein